MKLSLDVYKDGELISWLWALQAFKDDETGKLDKIAGEIEFQRGLLMVIKLYGSGTEEFENVVETLKAIGASRILTEANEMCNCARTGAKHFRDAIIKLLRGRGALRAA